jgi:hypothetical protein
MRKVLTILVLCAAAAMPTLAGTPSAPAAETGSPGWLSLSASIIAEPDSSIAWPLALGFLGLVVLRRTRSGPMM